MGGARSPGGSRPDGAGSRSRVARGYGLLVRLLPAALRRHGHEMERAFEERVSEARAEGGGTGWLLAVAAGYGDVVVRSIYERARRLVPTRAGWAGLATDLRFAFRGFVRKPGVTLVAVLMLSLGVAATTAVFTLVDGLYLRPLPFPEPDRLVYVDETAPEWDLEYVGIRYYDFAVWREGQEAFDALGLLSAGSFNLSSSDGVERVDGAAVTHDLADALGIVPVLGRSFTAEEDSPGGPAVVMLGYDLWRSRFGGSPEVVGRTIQLNSEPHTVVGVLPPEASFPGEVQLWTPLAEDPAEEGGYSYNGIGRLKPGVTLEAAESELLRVHQAIWEESEDLRVVSPVVEPLRDRLVGDLRGTAMALAVAVGLVLLIACGNVASILLARSFARRKELGVRVALGAGSGRIARQLFAESLALALVAGPLGVVLGFGLVRALAAGVPEGLPSWAVLAPSWRMALFGLGLIASTTVLFGWAPVLQARRGTVRSALAEDGGRTGVSRAQRRTMDVLVVAEVTLATLLLVAGGLLTRGFQQLQAVDPGFRSESVLSFRVALPESTYPDSSARDLFYRELSRELRALPGVRAVGGIDCPPLSCHSGAFFAAEGGLGTDPDDANPVVLYRFATPGYFDAMGIGRAAGRLLEPDDRRTGAPNVVVINETFARTFFAGVDDPVGRRITQRGHSFDEDAWEVVGVARDVKHYGVDEEMRPALYFPYDATDRASLALFLWTDMEPTALLPDARARVADLDPALPLFQVRTTESALHESLATRRATAWSMMIFAALALVLALGGIYGVLSYAVGQRAREIGIRIALGATRTGVLRLVLRHGALLALAGTTLGLLGALLAGPALEGLLAGFSALDPLTYAATALVLLVAALLASWVPARRAVAVEAGEALRAE